ncbi:unnamed protein product [Urochloa humidicola]
MEANHEESSLWPYWTGAWPDSYLLEEDALLSSLPFPSLHFQPSCLTITPSNILQDELDAIFKDDALKHWDDMEQADSKTEDGHSKMLPLLCYGEEKEVSSNSDTKQVPRDSEKKTGSK